MQFKVWARLPHTLGVSSYETVYCLLPSACFNATSSTLKVEVFTARSGCSYQNLPAVTSENFMKFPHLKLPDLEQHATLGTGSFGRVRLCQHKDDGKFYALKILKKTEVLYLKQVQQQPHAACRPAAPGASPRCRPPSLFASVPASTPTLPLTLASR
jgi:hypothetical protein